MSSIPTLIGNSAPTFDLPCTPLFRSGAEQGEPGGLSRALAGARFLPTRFFLSMPDGADRALSTFRRICRPELRPTRHQLRLRGITRAVDRHALERGGLGGLSFPLASDLDGSAARAFGVYQEQDHLAVRGLFIIDPAGIVQYQVVHSLSVGRAARGFARAGRIAVGRSMPRGLDGGQPDDRPIRGDPTGPFLFPLFDRSGSRLRDVRTCVPCTRFAARPLGGTESVQARLSGNAKCRPRRGPRGGRLNHPNLCTIYAVDDSAGVPIISMEYIAGESLSKAAKPGRLGPDSLLSISGQIASGMAAAHAEGIVHGDLKPENVMVTAEGVVKVLDFGLRGDCARDARFALTRRRAGARRSK